MIECDQDVRPPLESCGDRVRIAAATGGNVQVALREKPGGGQPNLGAARFMGYDAVLGGARGVWYSSATQASGTAQELRAMAPIFASGRPVELPFPAPAEGWGARVWTYHGRDYLVLANRTGNRYWRVPEEALRSAWRPLFEARRDPRELLHAAQGAHYLKPYQVLVLESRLRLSRLLGS